MSGFRIFCKDEMMIGGVPFPRGFCNLSVDRNTLCN